MTLCSYQASGQQAAQYHLGNYSVSHYNDQNGLPQNSVKSIGEDSDGFIWLATENGLVRFDGLTFYVFNNLNLDVSSNRFQWMQPDMHKPFDRLYVSQEEDRFIWIKNGIPTIDSAAFNEIFERIGSTYRDRNAYFAVGAPDGVGPYINPKNYIIPITGEEGAYFLYRDGKLEIYRNWRKQRQVLFREPGHWKWFRHGKVLFSSAGSRVFKRIASAERYDSTRTRSCNLSLSGDIRADPLYEDKSRKITLYWNNASDQVFLSLGGNLYILARPGPDTFDTKLILSGFNLEANYIRSVLYSATTGRLFLGSNSNGLFVIKKNEFHVVSSSSGGIDDVFYAHVRADSNWIQTANGRIFSSQGEVSAEAARKIRAARSEMLDYRIGIDQRGNVWTVRSKTLYCFASDGFSVKGRWDLGSELSDIHLGHDGTLWIAMARNLLYRASYKGDSVRVDLAADLQLKDKRINFLLHQQKDTIWIGTGAGVYSYKLTDRKLTLLTATSGYDVRSLYMSEQMAGAHLWITSNNKGFALYANGSLTAFPLDRNGYLASSHFILEDKSGYFWIPTNKGLFQTKKSDLLAYARKQTGTIPPYYFYYSANDGFKTNEFNGGCRPCFVRLAGGHVSIPSMSGLLWFVPEAIIPKLPTEGMFFDRVETPRKTVMVSGDELILSQGEGDVNIFLSTPFFGNSSNLVLAYALTKKGQRPDGDDWNSFNLASGINVSRLEYGRYVLTVRKRTGFGTRSFLYKSIQLHVLPRWYQTWFFKIFVVFATILLLYRVQRLSIRRIERRNRNLESKIAARTHELHETLSSLRSSQDELTRQLRLHIRMIASISHDVRAPIAFIGKMSGRIESILSENNPGLVVRIGQSIESTTERLLTLIGTMVAFTKTEISTQGQNYTDTDLLLLVNEKAQLFGPILAEHRTKLRLNIEPGASVYTNSVLLSIVLHNLIDNAIKAKPEGQIDVYTQIRKSRLHLVVADDGPGMPEGLVAWLNDRTNRENGFAIPPSDYEGLGLLMIKEITYSLGFDLLVENLGGCHFHLIFGHPSL